MLQNLIGPVTGLLDKFIPDADEKAKLAHEIATMAEKQAHEANMGQLEINKMEAQHRSVFIAGWRPFLGLGTFVCHDMALCPCTHDYVRVRICRGCTP